MPFATQLHISILGPPLITVDDQTLTIGRLQNRALLYRLAAQAQPVARDHLILLFWPDIPDARARRNLTQLMSHVRRSLPDPDLLIATKEHVQLDPERVQSDVVAFERLSARDATASLRQAVALYRDTLLTGVTMPDHPEYESWLSGERFRLEKRFLDTVDLLVEEEMAQGNYGEVVSLAERYLVLDELAEEMHRQLMEAYAAQGNRSAALRQYEQCVTVLDRELGVEPLPETEAVYQAIVAGAQPVTEPADTEPRWTTLPGLDVPMVGREELMQALANAFRYVQTGQGQVVLVGGEVGIGKSRLMQEFAASVAEQAQILVGACHSNTQSMPYQPLVEALRPHLQRKEVILALPATWRREAAPLFPELNGADPEFNGGGSIEGDPVQARGRFFEALRLLVEALSISGRPLLLCVEDLHWADAATLDWLLYLARQMRRARILVLVTYRSEEAEAVDDLRRDLGRLRNGVQLSLERLNQEQVEALVEHSGMGEDSDLTLRLWQATDGNPFFLLEILRDLIERGGVVQLSSMHELPISDNIRETVQRRLRHLQPLARQLLEAGSIWGGAFTFDSLRQTAGRSEAETVDGLDELLGRNVLVEVGQEIGFHHDLTRAVVYDGLSRWRRKLLHRRAAETLEGWLPERPAAERAQWVAQIGHHYAEAEEMERGANFLLEAGDYARNLYDDQTALAHYERALTLLRELDDQSRVAATLMKIGLTHHSAMNFDASRTAYEEGFSLHQRTGQMTRAAVHPPAPHLLRIGYHDEPTDILDPGLVIEMYAQILVTHLFSGLVQLSSALDVFPDVARRWEVLNEGRTYRFQLRTDIFWTDGTPVTAHDFVYAWRRVLNPDTGAHLAHLLYDIRGARAYHQGEISDPGQIGIQAPDATTLVVELAEPTGYFLQLLSYPIAFPVPRHRLETPGLAWDDPQHLVVNGPFTLVKRYDDGGVLLERNPAYHGVTSGNAAFVHYFPRGEWTERLARYRADEIDVLPLFYPPSAESRRARQELAADYLSHPQASTDHLYFNTTRAPLDDINVRRALAMAVDKEMLAYVVMEGYAEPATGGFVPPGLPGHLAENPLPFEPDRARKLLAQAATDPRAIRIELMVNSSLRSIGEFLQQQWREHLGLSVTLAVLEWSEFVTRVGEAQITFVGWMADYPDPDAFLGKGPVQALGHWSDEIYEWLAEQAKQSLDQRERLDLYRQMDRMLVEEVVIAPLTYARNHLLVKPWVTHLSISPMRHMLWQDVIIEPH